VLLCRAWLWFLRTDKERVGGVERFVRVMLLVLPYTGMDQRRTTGRRTRGNDRNS
jgi:hypothetical protein